MILLKNGSIVLNNKLVKKDILIDNDIIIKIDDSIDNNNYEVLDCKNTLVMPGAIDVHVHLREPGFENKETILTGTKAAAKGGFSVVMSMPNLKPCPHNVDNLMKQEEIIKRDAVINVYPYASVSVNEEDKELSDIDLLSDKVYALSDDGRGVNNIELLEKAMKLAKKYNLIIASHAEDSVYKYAPAGEYVAVRREIELAKKVGCKYHFCHMSTKESFEAIREAKKNGYNNITCEVAPHHLVLNETMIKNTNYKMNPPLRSEENRLETIKWLTIFIKKIENNEKSKGLFLTGNFGCGKTYVVAAAFNELAKKGKKVACLYYPEFLRSLKERFSDDYREVFDKVKKCDLLLIDDIGAETVTSWNRDEVLGTILQYRMQESLPTFFTSNLSLKELEVHLAGNDSEGKIKARRIIERIKYLTDNITMIAENRRK